MKAHWMEGSQPISQAELLDEGIPNSQHSTDVSRYRARLDELKGRRGYVQEDVVALGPDTPNLDAVCAKFVDEHHHDDDEVRFVLAGEGIFDIRSRDDRWMRVQVEAGDLIVVPARRHHRFLLTEKKRIECIRLFKDVAGWEPHYR
ncbi:MAG: cupin domain-containing protein [Myxococcales bacterium]|nr:cupin domain-containing protein [Myxococcales bacterium]MDD9967721.1 cupin domain-containing protein [Myxococcales bacterium]